MTDESSDFLYFLSKLQELIGSELGVKLLLEDRFFSFSFNATLERVESPLDGDEVTLLFSNGASLDLAPNEQIVLSNEDAHELLLGPGLSVELAADPTP